MENTDINEDWMEIQTYVMQYNHEIENEKGKMELKQVLFCVDKETAKTLQNGIKQTRELC